MNKKLICLVLAVAMLCMGSFAFAEESASVQTSDLYAVSGNDGILRISIVNATEFAQSVLRNITEFVKDGAATDFFDVDFASYLPAGYDPALLSVSEVISFDPTVVMYADVTMAFTFPTEFEDGAVVVALVGIVVDGEVTWYPLEANVVDGKVEITFTAEILELMDGADELVLAVLSGDETEE